MSKHSNVNAIFVVTVLILAIMYSYSSAWGTTHPFLMGMLANFMVFLVAHKLELIQFV